MMFRILFLLIWPLLRLYIPRTVRVRVIIQKENSYLFVKNKLSWSNVWHFPGGGIKKGETILQAVLREMSEELNIDVADMQIVDNGALHHIKQSGLVYKLVFVRARIDEDAKISINHEIATYQWRLFSEADTTFAPEVKAGLKLL